MVNNDRQPIFKISVAMKLLHKGFPIKDLMRDKRNKEKAIFFFDKSPEFYKAWANIRDEENS